MLQKKLPNVFPLHLAPIDQFFCTDDTDRFPMTSIIHLDFEGQVDRAAFESALDMALHRHQLLRSHIRPVKRNLPCWVRGKQQLPWIDYGELGAPIQLPGSERLDLSKDTGLRFWVRNGEEKSRISVQVHHACTDGTGVYRFLGDLLAAYAAATNEDSDVDTTPAFADVDPLLLRNRRRKMADVSHYDFSIPRYIAHGLGVMADVFGRSIRPLQLPKGQATNDKPIPFPGIFTVEIDRQTHKKLRAVAGDYGCTLNDLMMAEMFRTIMTWNKSAGKGTGNPWLRIMMPFDLRDQADYHMPAANMTSYTFVTRRQADCVDVQTLVNSIRDETLKLKHNRAGTSFIDAISLSAHAPFVLKFLLRSTSCIASTCLSNIGDPSKRFTADLPRAGGKIVAGNLTLAAISGVPPLRKGTHATLAVFSYLRKLTICVRCDPYKFTAEQSQSFVEMFRDRLLSNV